MDFNGNLLVKIAKLPAGRLPDPPFEEKAEARRQTEQSDTKYQQGDLLMRGAPLPKAAERIK